MSIGYSLFFLSLFFFQDTLIKRYFSSSPISASVDPPGCRCPVYSISEILILSRCDAFRRRNRSINGELRDSPPTRSARRSLIVAAAKLETAGTRSRWPGLTSRVSRLTMLQFSLSAQFTVTPARNIAHVRRERKTAGQCANSLPSYARKSLNGCSVIAILCFDRIR